jgi:hypothetical protein
MPDALAAMMTDRDIAQPADELYLQRGSEQVMTSSMIGFSRARTP